MAPPSGEKITLQNGKLFVPDHPIVPFIEGDGTGRDIWRASQAVFDAAVEKAYKGKKKIAWFEVLAGEKAFKTVNNWLPDETVAAFREYLVGIKGPLTTPIGGGIRSLNVALRQMLDLYVCLRPVRYFKGVPCPVKTPEKVDMVIFRENTEDIYAGIEFEAGSAQAHEGPRVPEEGVPEGLREDPLPARTWASASSPCRRKARSAWCAPPSSTPSRTSARASRIVHKGNIMKYTEGALPQVGLRAGRARVRRQGLHLGSVGGHQGRQG